MIRLILYESIDCYKVAEHIHKTKLVAQLGEEFSPYLNIHYCSTLDKPHYELMIDNDILKFNFENPKKDYKKLKSEIWKHIPEKSSHKFNTIYNYAKAKKYNKKNRFTCPNIKYPEEKKHLHRQYELLYKGNYKKPISREVRRNMVTKTCKRYHKKDSPLYKLCVKNEDNYTQPDTNKENFIINTNNKLSILKDIRLWLIILLFISIVYFNNC